MTREERKELNYLIRKEKVCPLDKYERFRLDLLMSKTKTTH